MADDDYDIPVGTPPEGSQKVGTLADFGKVLGAGALNVGSNLAGLSRYFFDAGNSQHGSEISKALQDVFSTASDEISDTLNPKTKELLSSTLTSEEFLSHPLIGTALKATGMVPAVAALAIPGGILADAVGATAVVAAGGGALNAGGVIDEFYKKIDDASDDELKAQSPYYASLREAFDEKQARKRFATKMLGMAPAINAVIGAAAGAVGPAGTVARGLVKGGESAVVGAGERGALASGAIGAAEGAGANAVQGGVADVTGQQAQVNAGLEKEIDTIKTANAALEGGVLGGVMGGVAGAAMRGKTPSAKSAAKLDKALGAADDAPEVPNVASNDTTPQPKTGTTGTPAKPVEAPTVGNPQNAPTRGSRDGAKESKVTSGGKAPVEVVTPAGPDAGQAAAIAANDAVPGPVAPTESAAAPVAAALQRVQNPTEAAPASAPEAAPAPAPPAVADASRRLDTGQNLPEQPATLSAQLEQLAAGNKPAVMFPKGTKELPELPQGMNRIETPRGVFFYNPKQVKAGQILRASRDGNENQVLGLGPVSKPEAEARVAAGETPVAVTERAPDGTEVRAAAGTDQTAPVQAASLESTKTPGNTVAVESPQQVRTGRILPDLTQTPHEPVTLPGLRIAETKEPTGKKYSKQQIAERNEMLARAKSITDKHVPSERENDYMRVPEARDAVIARARAMLDEAKEAGVKIQAQLKKSIKGDAPSDHPSIQILRAAKDLEKVAAKRKTGRQITEATGKFAEAERLIRGGYSDEVLAQRREEGDVAMRRRPATEDVAAASETTPETELAKKEGVEVTSRDEATVTSEGKPDLEKDAVRTKAPSSAKGDVRGIGDGSDRPASAVRKVEASSAEKQAILERMNKLMAKPKRDADPFIAAASEVAREPTEAQKAAGNYKKGHIKVDGLDVTLENPRGGMRRGVDENGKPWQVKMPDHYGYIKKTTGADGDHVDVYVGRSGDKHFIVDQVDHLKGEFDEHKVMLNYKDEAAAVEAYKKAFSDGRGGDRLGHIHEVTMDELKHWLNTGDLKTSHLEHVVSEPRESFERDMDNVNFDATGGPRPSIVAGNGVRVRPIRSTSAAEELATLDFSKANPLVSTIGRFFQTRLRKLAGETDVHYVTKADMQRLFDTGDPSQSPVGLHVRNRQTGHSEVYLRDDLHQNDGEYGGRAHVLLHELTHAVTVREIERVPGAERMIAKLAAVADRYIGDPDNYHMLMLEFGEDKLRYGFTNAKEFVAEAFSNPAFQEVLSRVPIDRDTADYLGINRNRDMSVWDVFRRFVQKAIEKLTGKLPEGPTALDGIIKVGGHLTAIHEIDHPSKFGDWNKTPQGKVQHEALMLMDDAIQKVKERAEQFTTQEHAPKLLALRTFDNIAQIADHYFGENNPVRKIHEAIEAMRTKGEILFAKSSPIIKRLVGLRAANPEQFAEFSRLLHDATVANVHPDVPLSDARNAHLGKDALKGVWAKSQHPELARRFNALPADLKAAWAETTRYFTDTQNKMSLGIINNQILKLMGIKDEALGRRIHEGALTDADRETLGSMLPIIERASELSKIEGPYVPLMRRGDFVVKGRYKIKPPSNAKVIAPNEFEFNTRKEAIDYASKSGLKPEIKSVWVDGTTGELHSVNAEGKEFRILKEDPDSVNKFRVKLNDEHVEFAATRAEAEARAAELAKDGSIDVHKVVPRQLEPNARMGMELSSALHSLVRRLESSDAYKQATPMQQAGLRQAIEQAALASHGSTRLQSKSLPRRGVKGYSEDMVRNTADYAASSSHYLAKLEHAPELESGIKEMQDAIKRDHSKEGQFSRQAIANDVLKRVSGDNGFEQGGKFSAITKRALSISFIDKLASPAYSVINAMQPGMVTMPYLAGRHGIARAFTTLGKAYSDIGALKVVGQATKETYRRLKGQNKPDDFISEIKSRLANDDERRMIDEHVRVGTVDPSAGLEIRELVRDTSGIGGKLDAGLGYLEGVTREMPRAIEAINRTVTALAAYRLERSRGASHDEAVKYSKDAVNNTQFNYSSTNAPTVFNHPLAKIALQFKKYGQGMYQLIGLQVGKAIRNASEGDRREAVKTLIALAATHTAIAGALGLPTEPFKYMLMGANAAGLTGTTWGDVENQVRQAAAGMFGKQAGEIATRGLPRFFNVDLSRAGLDSVTSFGEPKSNKDSDVKSWLFDSLAGPVVSLGGDWIKGLNQISNGDYERAAENLIPIKAASDSLRAYRQATEGKKSASGREVMSSYTPTEAAMRALGFGSGREAEIGAQRAAFYSGSNAQKDQRSSLVNAWVKADPSDKSDAMRAITKWNATVPPEVRIKPRELSEKVSRDAKAARKMQHGILANKRDKHFTEEGLIYNTQ